MYVYFRTVSSHGHMIKSSSQIQESVVLAGGLFRLIRFLIYFFHKLFGILAN